jgi:hypothetical protein
MVCLLQKQDLLHIYTWFFLLRLLFCPQVQQSKCMRMELYIVIDVNVVDASFQIQFLVLFLHFCFDSMCNFSVPQPITQHRDVQHCIQPAP